MIPDNAVELRSTVQAEARTHHGQLSEQECSSHYRLLLGSGY